MSYSAWKLLCRIYVNDKRIPSKPTYMSLMYVNKWVKQHFFLHNFLVCAITTWTYLQTQISSDINVNIFHLISNRLRVIFPTCILLVHCVTKQIFLFQLLKRLLVKLWSFMYRLDDSKKVISKKNPRYSDQNVTSIILSYFNKIHLTIFFYLLDFISFSNPSGFWLSALGSATVGCPLIPISNCWPSAVLRLLQRSVPIFCAVYIS